MKILEEISLRFQTWRDKHPGQTRYPNNHHDEAIELLEKYPIKIVEKALGVNERTLYRWKKAKRFPPADSTPISEDREGV